MKTEFKNLREGGRGKGSKVGTHIKQKIKG